MTELNEIQNQIKEFRDALDWSNPKYMKDYLLNMSEEIGEMWNLIKWLDKEPMMKVIEENKAEAENFIGDMLFLILTVSYECKINPQKAIDDVMKEYKQRFPVDKVKGNHGNKLAGGIDLKKE